MGMESFQHDGIWWDPNDPGQRWVGTVRFDKRNEITLKLTVPVESPVLKSPPQSYDFLLGRTTDGKAITLLDCHCYKRPAFGGFFGDAPRVIALIANSLILDFHIDTVDPLISWASILFRNMSRWWERSGLEVDTAKYPDFVVRYTPLDSLVLSDDGKFQVSVRPRCSLAEEALISNRVTLLEETRFEVRASTPKPLSEFKSIIQACGDFLSIACLTWCETDELKLLLPAVEGSTTKIGTFHAVPIDRSRGITHEGMPHKMLFRFDDIKDCPSEVFRSWLSHAEELYYVRALYFAGAYGGDFREEKFLFLIRALEALHRRFPVMLPEGTDERVRTSVKKRFTLRERLESLVQKHAEALHALVADPAAYVDGIVEHRNKFTHFTFDPKSRELNDENSVEPEHVRVLLYNFFLKLLLEACFLERMGFTTNKIAKLFRRSETYGQLRQHWSETYPRLQ